MTITTTGTKALNTTSDKYQEVVTSLRKVKTATTDAAIKLYCYATDMDPNNEGSLSRELEAQLAIDADISGSSVRHLYLGGKYLFNYDLAALDNVGISTLYLISSASDNMKQETANRLRAGEHVTQSEIIAKRNSPEEKVQKATESVEYLADSVQTYTEIVNDDSFKELSSSERRKITNAKSGAKANLQRARQRLDALNTEEAGIQNSIDPTIAKVLTEKDLALQAKERELEQLKVELEAAQQKDEWSSEDQLTTLLRKMLPNGVKHLPLSQQVMMAGKHLEVLDQKVKDSEDVTRVTGKNLAHRVELVNLTAAQWQELSITYTAAKRVCTDESMIARAEDGIRKSWRSWIEYLPLDMVEELQQMLDNRINHQNIQTAKPELQTIDI